MKKLSQFLKVALVCLFACVVSFNLLVGKALATGEFSKTCEDITLDGSTLSAFCEKADGYTLNKTSINLDESVGNLDGTLSWGDHNYSLTCKDIGLSQSLFSRTYVLNAQCEKRDGYTYIPTEIDLDAHIANIDGNLKFE